MLERRLTLIPGSVVVCMCVIALMTAAAGDEAQLDDEVSSGAMDFAPMTVNENADSEPEERAPEAQMQARDSNVHSLQIACPDMRTKMSEECFAALDEHFKDYPLILHPDDRLLHDETLPTFGRIFADPIGDRDRAVAALSDEACRLEQGPVRTELQADCHAASIANHALFNSYCSVMHGTFQSYWLEPHPWFEGASYYQQALNQLESLHWENLDDYHASIQELKERMYQDAWLNLKCSHFGTQIRQPLNFWPETLQSVEKHVSKQYGEDRTRWSEDAKLLYQMLAIDAEYSHLLAISARLGDAWAMVTYYQQGWGDDEFLDSVMQLRPWLPPLLETIKMPVSRVNHLTNAVEAVLVAEQDGLTIDKELLASVVCKEREDVVDCEIAFDQLDGMELSPRERQIAEELRSISSQLEPESKCFDEAGQEVWCGIMISCGVNFAEDD